MKRRVALAMSGGVDSSVAAALLVRQGHEVIGLTMCFGLTDSSGRKPACCGLQAIEDARRVAHKLGIRHYVLNMHKHLREFVINDFCREYLNGRTPNPCVRCNQYIKFGVLLKKARALGADFLATGHYARIEKTDGFILKKAKDKKKDQTYFLYRLNQHQLKHTLFPLGNHTKEQVRKLAAEFDLPVADKPASQEICFLPDADYRAFLKKNIAGKIEPGFVVDLGGKVLGPHKGVACYTIGQREGLGLALGYPAYITSIDHKNNRIIVGKKEDAFKKEFTLKSVRIYAPFKKKIAVKVRIRYNHREASAAIDCTGRKIRVTFKRPQFAVTPGQAAVFYEGELVVGGGIIDKILR